MASSSSRNIALFAIIASILSGCLSTTVLRLNSVGYQSGDTKTAVLMSTTAISTSLSFFVALDINSRTVYLDDQSLTQTSVQWSATYPYTYQLDFSPLTTPGTYRIALVAKTSSALGIVATSGSFKIASSFDTYGRLLSNSLFFFRAQRDGPNVDPTVMNRKPSHLADATATVYNTPSFNKDGALSGSLTSTGQTVDVSGGWFDAGDYLKFVQTASYVEAMMLMAYRDYGSAVTDSFVHGSFLNETLFGIDWLLKMWNPTSKTMYYQVGVGDGNNNILGDHDNWRLPEADDKLNTKAGNDDYYVKYRPVFQTTTSISPNLAGRMTAAFALCSQVYSTSNPTLASKCLTYAKQVYAGAATNPAPKTLTSAAPFDFYPETEWRDDMELGATQLYLATKDTTYLTAAASFASDYIKNGEHDVINLYDVSGIAHYELAKAISSAPSSATSGLKVTKASLLADMKERLDSAVTQSKKDPFRFGDQYNGGDDLVPHAFGFWIQASLYDELAGTSTYHTFQNQQRDWIFGNNAWGVSMVVGAGSNYALCMQHQVANLAGSLTGVATSNAGILLGAIYDGPSDSANFKGLDSIDGAKACPASKTDPYSTFTGQGVSYQDNVASWPSVEPADDYTVIGLYAFARSMARSE